MPCATVPATGDAEVHALVRSLFSDSFANTTQIILKFSCVCAVEKREIVGRHWKSGFLSDLSCTFFWVKADSCHGTVQPVRQVSPVCRATSPGHEGFIWQCKDKRAGSLPVSLEWEKYSHILFLEHRLQLLYLITCTTAEQIVSKVNNRKSLSSSNFNHILVLPGLGRKMVEENNWPATAATGFDLNLIAVQLHWCLWNYIWEIHWFM